MFDDLTLEIFAPEYYRQTKGKSEPFKYRGLLFSPNYYSGNISSWHAMLKNLKIQIFVDKLRISNSIHKYYKGNNYSDFYLCELYEAFESLSERLGIDVFKARIKNFEIGCNILFEKQEAFLDGLNSYNGNYFEPMKDKKTKYGKKLFATDYNVKFYNKTIQTKINDKIDVPYQVLRSELQVRYLRYLQKKGISVYRVEDFFKPEIIKNIILEIFKIYKRIDKIFIPNLEDLNQEELKCYGILKDHEITKVSRSKYPRNFFSYKNKISKKIDHAIFDKIESLMAEKFNQLSEGYFQTCNILEKV